MFQPQNTTTRPGLSSRPIPKDPAVQIFRSLGHPGFQGRNFVATGPDAGELTRLNGRPAKEPIRVYAGLQTAATDLGRLSILMTELERTHAFDRKVLAIVPTTGTGWVDPIAARSLELDVQRRHRDGGSAVFVSAQLDFVCRRCREVGGFGPMLIQCGGERMGACRTTGDRNCFSTASLGSLAVRRPSAICPTSSRMGFDSVLWVGSAERKYVVAGLIDGRDPGSTEVAPRYDAGRTVRFSRGRQRPPRYARHRRRPGWACAGAVLAAPSDPIVWWSSDPVLPAGLVGGTARQRPSAAMRWYPFVTFSRSASTC